MISPNERIVPLTAPPYCFAGKKPAAVLFGEERVEVKSWRQAYLVIMGCCNRECHERLTYLRDKTAGKVRVFLSARPDGMTRPVKIDEDMYGETHYGSETLMRVLRKRILDPARFDYFNISVAVKQ